MKKKILIGLCGFVLLIVIALIVLTNGLSEGQNVVLNGVDLLNVSDGDYTGTYKQGRWTNTIIVHVKNNEIVEINIIKDVLAAKTEWSEEVFQRVLEKQNTQIDTVSGATVTSKAYLKAIEDALNI